MTPREWNNVLDRKVEWSIAYPAVEREAKAYLAYERHVLAPGISTTDLVEALYPEQQAYGDGIYARRRIFTALGALWEHGLAGWCHQEEPTRARFGKMVRRIRWHAPTEPAAAQAWQWCHVGSCARHQACMYGPCRAAKVSQEPAVTEVEAVHTPELTPADPAKIGQDHLTWKQALPLVRALRDIAQSSPDPEATAVATAALHEVFPGADGLAMMFGDILP